MTRTQMATSMKGDGYYDLHSQVQRNVVTHSLPLINKTISRMGISEAAQPFTIVDYGCSEGNNSRLAVHHVIELVRKHIKTRPIQVVHNDLPTNNFNQLFDQVYDKGRSLFATEYGATAGSSVFVLASGQSFYTQVVPASTVDLGLTFSSAHWTTAEPVIKNHIYVAGANKQETAKFAAIAANDWLNFLSSRATELVSGGRLIASFAARLGESAIATEPKPESGETHSGQIVLDLLNHILQDLASEKFFEREVLEQYTLPVYGRSQKEVAAPCQPGGALHGVLEVEHMTVEVVSCPLYAHYKISGDAIGYARALTSLIRAFTEPSLLHGLFGVTERRRPERDIARGQRVLNEVYERVQAAISINPDKYTFHPIHTETVFKKL